MVIISKSKWEIPDELLQTQVPKNIIQPIMENALYHGLAT